MRHLRNHHEPIQVDAYWGELEARLREVPGLIAVYLYGSYGTPLQTPLSDVDLALVFRLGSEPSFDAELELAGVVTETLREEDVSAVVLNRSPSPFQYRVLSTGRKLFATDETALSDFVEQVCKRHGDFVIDYERFAREYDQALVEAYG
ncbi:MAG: nucleotidyltransferase domain-containing protein [Thermoanaerobaculia bacterium]|nr:nucleotidyltransferase domain-containing protein [Thermoanaerobaculia bacterium]